MLIKKIWEPDISENYAEIHYKELNQEVLDAIHYFEKSKLLIGKNNGETKLFYLSDILFCEIVDRKCFSYLKDGVWQIDFSLQSFLEEYATNGFVRISKSMIVNIYKIDYMKTDVSMRMKLILENGECIILNRAYRRGFYALLEKIGGEDR